MWVSEAGGAGCHPIRAVATSLAPDRDGRALLLALGDVAVARGVRAFLLDIHPENAKMARLARSLGARLISSEGITRGVLPIPSDTGVAAGLRYAA